MGCDIHAHSEIKINGTWHHLSELQIARNYTLFTRMAGVRNDGQTEPISEPRDLPDDVSFITKFISDAYGVDGHSHSYLIAEEVIGLCKFMEDLHKQYNPSSHYWAEKDFGFIFGNSWESFTLYTENLPPGVEDGRLVFWFDN